MEEIPDDEWWKARALVDIVSSDPSPSFYTNHTGFHCWEIWVSDITIDIPSSILPFLGIYQKIIDLNFIKISENTMIVFFKSERNGHIFYC